MNWSWSVSCDRSYLLTETKSLPLRKASTLALLSFLPMRHTQSAFSSPPPHLLQCSALIRDWSDLIRVHCYVFKRLIWLARWLLESLDVAPRVRSAFRESGCDSRPASHFRSFPEATPRSADNKHLFLFLRSAHSSFWNETLDHSLFAVWLLWIVSGQERATQEWQKCISLSTCIDLMMEWLSDGPAVPDHPACSGVNKTNDTIMSSGDQIYKIRFLCEIFWG